MRVVVLHSSFATTGGAEIYVQMLCEDLAAEGHSVKLITGDNFGIVAHNRNQSKLSRYWFQLMDIFGPSRRKIIKSVDDFEPDLVHLNNWARLRSSTIERISKKYPVLFTIHDYYTVDPSGTSNEEYHSKVRTLINMRSKILFHKYRKILFHFPAQRTKERFSNYSRIYFNNFLIFPLNIKLPEFRYCVPDDHYSFAYIGQLEPHKGILEFAKDFEIYSTRNMSLVIAGDGSQRQAIGEIASKSDKISYVGWLDLEGKTQLLEKISWLIFPSDWFENFPIVCCEALASGVPIISKDISAPPMANNDAVVTYGANSRFKDVKEILDYINNMSDADYLLATAAALSSKANFQDGTQRQAAYNLLRIKGREIHDS